MNTTYICDRIPAPNGHSLYRFKLNGAVLCTTTDDDEALKMMVAVVKLTARMNEGR